MKYFLLTNGNPAVTGPFELDDIGARLQTGGLSADTLAIGGTAEGLSGRNWLPLHAIPGLGLERPRNLASREASLHPLTPALPPPTELFSARDSKKSESPPEQIRVCPFCGQRAAGPEVLGETRCGQCGKLLYPASGAGEGKPLTRRRPVFSLEFADRVLVGLIAQFSSFIFVCLRVAKSSSDQELVIFAILLCLAWVSIAIPLTRKPAIRPLAFGILLGVGLTAILTANCALNGK
jgi:hypothetical protein